MQASAEARRLWPYLLPLVQRAVTGTLVGGSGAPGIGGAPSPHALDSAHHTGTLANGQAPQFLLRDGTRSLTGNLEVESGITIDGVDLSAHVADPDAHHDRATAGNGIVVSGQQVAIDLAANSKLEFLSGDLAVDLDAAFTWTNTHQFNADPQINSNLDFIGGDRAITAVDDLSLEPDDDLWLRAGGFIMLADDQELRTSEIVDLPTGIRGLRLWERSDAVNYWQLTMGAAKFDELYARVFVADETRIDRGEEYWSKSFGLVETDFVLPAIGSTVDVWFENSPALAGANLFSVNDWLLMRVIDWGTGLLIMKCWMQVHSLITAGTVDGERQRWRLTRKKFGTTGVTVKKGSTILDAGQPGQGWLHLSALSQDGGPFFQLGIFTEVISDEPIFVPYTRMGRLGGTVDYGDDGTFGFVTGNNLGLEPDAGFSGMASDSTKGLRLFNTAIEMYDSGDLVLTLNGEDGLRMMLDDNPLVHGWAQIGWYDDVTSTAAPYTRMGAHKLSPGESRFTFRSRSANVGDESSVDMRAEAGGTSITSMLVLHAEDGASFARLDSDGYILLSAEEVISGASLLPQVDDTYDLGSPTYRWRTLYVDALEAGTISGSSISGSEWEHSGNMTIDANSGSATTVFVTNQGAGIASLDVEGNITLGGTIDGIDLAAHVANASAHHAIATAGDGIGISGQVVAVDATVARTTRNLVAGNGLTGGGTLAADRTFNVGAGDGIAVAADEVAVFLATDPGLAFASGGLHVKEYHGIQRNSNGIGIKLLSPDSGLVVDTNGLRLGTPATLDINSVNSLDADNSGNQLQSHAITASADVGTTPAASLLKSTGAGGLTLGTLTVKGSVDIINGGDLTVGSNVLFVDNSLAGVGINRAPDPQFALDVNGPIRGTELVGKHAIQLDDVELLLHFDGGHPYETNYTGELNAIPMGRPPSSNSGNFIFRPGKFYKAVVIGRARTNMVTNPSFETNTTGWLHHNEAGGDLSFSRVNDDSWFGDWSCKLTWTAVNISQFYHNFTASSVTGNYSYGVWMRAAVPCDVTILMRRHNSPFTVYATKTVSVTEEWQYFNTTTSVDGSGAIPSAGLPLRVSIEPQTNGANSLWVDAVQVEQAAANSWYIDGSLGNGYTWSGAAHASTSSKTASDLVYTFTDVPKNRWTAMGWFCWPAERPPSAGSGALHMELAGESEHFEVFVDPTGVNSSINTGSGVTYNLVEGGPLQPGRWYHYAVTYTPGAVKVFIDGELKLTVNATFDYAPSRIYVGQMDAGLGDAEVMVDDLCVSRQCLTDERIRAIYESDAPVFATTSTFMFRATPKGLVWADEEGLWMRDTNGNSVLGAYGGDAATKSWGGFTLGQGDIAFGRYGASDGGWLYFDRDGVSSKPYLSLGYNNISVLALDAGGAALTGVLEISSGGGIKIGANTVVMDVNGLAMAAEATTPLRFLTGAAVTGSVEQKTASGAKYMYLRSGGNGYAGVARMESYTSAGALASHVTVAPTDIVLDAGDAQLTVHSTAVGAVMAEQLSATGARAALLVGQNDLSEEFIQFNATIGAGNPIDTAALGSYYGKVRVSVNGTFKYIGLYNS